MRFDNVSAEEEIKEIREVCGELGLDEDMTALILGSHRRDRTLPAPSVDDHENLRGYVRRKLAIWEEIFDGPICGLPEPTEPA